MPSQHESCYQQEETSKINELRELLRDCWSLVPDGTESEKIASIKRGMTKFDCWPEIEQ